MFAYCLNGEIAKHQLTQKFWMNYLDVSGCAKTLELSVDHDAKAITESFAFLHARNVFIKFKTTAFETILTGIKLQGSCTLIGLNQLLGGSTGPGCV